MTLAVVGSRDFHNYEMIEHFLDRIHSKTPIHIIISGGANGADALAERYAKERDIIIVTIEAEWDKYGKAAGFIRNNNIWVSAQMGIAFWDGSSRGTSHSFDLARKYNKKLLIVDYTNQEIYLNKRD